jgi:hypothetical protein
MNTSNIDALAIAAEVRANEAIAGLRRVSTLSAHLFNDRSTTPSPRVAAAASVPPLPPIATQGSHHHDVMNTPQPQKQRAPSAISPNRRKPSFAEKLHAILANKSLSRIVTWLPSGKSFCVLDKERFTKQVLPVYFREAKFESFSRRIKRWGFRKMYTTGLKQVIYTHELFQKDRLDLCNAMNGKASQCTKEIISLNAVSDAAKIEDAMTEQVAFAKQSREAPSAAAPKQKRPVQQMQTRPVKKRFVSSHQTSPVPRPLPLSYVPVSILRPHLPMDGIMQQMHMPQMGHIGMNSMGMANCTSPSSAANFNYPRQSMPHAADLDIARQLSSIDEDIAECEEQLVILQRLKELKERRRALGR